jgi:hypothetical protein
MVFHSALQDTYLYLINNKNLHYKIRIKLDKTLIEFIIQVQLLNGLC